MPLYTINTFVTQAHFCVETATKVSVAYLVLQKTQCITIPLTGVLYSQKVSRNQILKKNYETIIKNAVPIIKKLEF